MNASRKIISVGVLLAALFAFMLYVFPGGAAVEIMNGAIIGVGVVIFLTFRALTWDTLRGRGQYARAQQMALGLAIMWLGVNLRTLQSISYRITNDPEVLNSGLGAFITLMFIVAGMLQATAPGLGKGLLHGQSKSRVAAAVVIGCLVTWGVIWLQRA